MEYPPLINLTDAYMNLSAYYKANWPEYYMAFHRHVYYEIMYVDSGFCTVEILSGNGNTKTLHLKKNEFVLLDTNVSHKLTVLPKDGCDIFNLELNLLPVDNESGYAFDFKNIIKSCDGIKSILVNANYLNSKDMHYVKPVIQRIQKTFESINKAVGRKQNLKILLQILIGELFLEIDKCCESYSLAGNILLYKAIKLIKANYQNKISITNIAAHLKVNKSYLHKVFKKHGNTTVHNYLNNYRIKKSIDLLSNSDFPVIDIAFEVGFNSRQSYFNAFMKSEGISPNEYRRLHFNQNKQVMADNYVTENVSDK